MDEHVLTATRRSLHAVAEQLLAGPQHRTQGTIRLRITPGGFGQIAGPWRVDGSELVGPDLRVPLTGTIADIARAAGVEPGAPTIYADHADLAADASLAVDPAAAAELADWFARGDAGLRAFAPDEQPVLWPEHFDLADRGRRGQLRDLARRRRPRGPVRLHRAVDPARGAVLERRVRLAAPRGRAARRRRGGHLLRRGPRRCGRRLTQHSRDPDHAEPLSRRARVPRPPLTRTKWGGTMKVLVAGASGVIGRPLLPLLESAGHEVVGLARTVRPGPTRMLAVDALDRDAVAAAVREVAPDAVVNVLTAIPARLNPRRMSTEFALTNRLRTEGTRNLVDAARAVGVRRLIAEGLAYAYDPAGAGLADEDEPLWRRPPAGFASALAALKETSEVSSTSGIFACSRIAIISTEPAIPASSRTLLLAPRRRQVIIMISAMTHSPTNVMVSEVAYSVRFCRSDSVAKA